MRPKLEFLAVSEIASIQYTMQPVKMGIPESHVEVQHVGSGEAVDLR